MPEEEGGSKLKVGGGKSEIAACKGVKGEKCKSRARTTSGVSVFQQSPTLKTWQATAEDVAGHRSHRLLSIFIRRQSLRIAGEGGGRKAEGGGGK
ncbi:MAG: hypothetical protein C7N36_07670 [Bacteroidetes bacterium]|nr:MAG: hypothetical protein C7N36_07670 [Bacteroidota bacterium]